jgi:hypothetical protein
VTEPTGGREQIRKKTTPRQLDEPATCIAPATIHRAIPALSTDR